MRMLTIMLAALLAAPAAAQAQAPKPAVKLWRLDCGTLPIADLNIFSDTNAYTGQSKTLTASCYLIRHGDAHMIWDTGLGAEFVGREGRTLSRTLVDQLRQLGVRPDQIGTVGISHYHSDHTGQAASFPKAKLLIGKGDLDALSATPPAAGLEPQRLAPWLTGGAPKETVSGDKDVFGDGTVTMLAMPGHTPGHHALLVRLPRTGAVLLAGDQYHFTEQVANRGVPTFNHDRAQTLASHDRFDRLAANEKARVVIQHEPADIAKLPAFPAAAE